MLLINSISAMWAWWGKQFHEPKCGSGHVSRVMAWTRQQGLVPYIGFEKVREAVGVHRRRKKTKPPRQKQKKKKQLNQLKSKISKLITASNVQQESWKLPKKSLETKNPDKYTEYLKSIKNTILSDALFFKSPLPYISLLNTLTNS